MKRIIGPRGTGKTKELMQMAQENNALFVCANPQAMRVKAHNYGFVGIDFVDYIEFMNGNCVEAPYVIDDLEGFIKAILYTDNLIGYTLGEE
jgi:hypothetical protein